VLDHMVSELCGGDELSVVMEQIDDSDSDGNDSDDLVIRCVVESPAGYRE